MANRLTVDNVVALAVRALRGENDDQLSLNSPYEVIALIGHACMKALDFRLLGLGEEHNIGLSTCF